MISITLSSRPLWNSIHLDNVSGLLLDELDGRDGYSEYAENCLDCAEDGPWLAVKLDIVWLGRDRMRTHCCLGIVEVDLRREERRLRGIGR